MSPHRIMKSSPESRFRPEWRSWSRRVRRRRSRSRARPVLRPRASGRSSRRSSTGASRLRAGRVRPAIDGHRRAAARPYDGVGARTARGRDRPAPDRPVSRARRSPRGDPRRTVRPGRSIPLGGGRARRRADRHRRAPREVPPLAAGERPDARRPPPHDRVAPPRCRWGLPDDAYRRATLELDTGASWVPRRPTLRHVGAARRRSSAPVPRRPARARATLPLVHRYPPRAPPRRAVGRRSRRSCSTSGASPGSGTSTPTRRSGAPGSILGGRRAGSTPARSPESIAPSARRSGAGSSSRARLCATTSPRTAPAGGCSTSSTSTAGSESRATGAAARSSGSSSAGAARGSAHAARGSDPGRRLSAASTGGRCCGAIGAKSAQSRHSPIRVVTLGYELWGGGRRPRSWSTGHVRS